MKQCTLMADLTVRRVILSVDLASLLPDLVMMAIIDLEMMSSNLEMAIKSTRVAGGWHCSVELTEC